MRNCPTWVQNPENKETTQTALATRLNDETRLGPDAYLNLDQVYTIKTSELKADPCGEVREDMISAMLLRHYTACVSMLQRGFGSYDPMLDLAGQVECDDNRDQSKQRQSNAVQVPVVNEDFIR
jgi:hypothetical protein